jgi:hypothetical protein
MIRHRRTLEQIAALARVGQHGNLSDYEALRHFVMIEHLANKALYNPGQPKVTQPPLTSAQHKQAVQSARSHGGRCPGIVEEHREKTDD